MKWGKNTEITSCELFQKMCIPQLVSLLFGKFSFGGDPITQAQFVQLHVLFRRNNNYLDHYEQQSPFGRKNRTSRRKIFCGVKIEMGHCTARRSQLSIYGTKFQTKISNSWATKMHSSSIYFLQQASLSMGKNGQCQGPISGWPIQRMELMIVICKIVIIDE